MTVSIRAMSAMVVVSLVSVTMAQTQEQPPTLLPPVTVKPPSHVLEPERPHESGGTGTRTNDKNGDGEVLEQLNRNLKRKVDEVNPTTNMPPIDARSPDTRTGVINIPGVQQQYGKNFGRSVFPYRPSPPIYSAPLGHR